jgi:hypothetical protein
LFTSKGYALKWYDKVFIHGFIRTDEDIDPAYPTQAPMRLLPLRGFAINFLLEVWSSSSIFVHNNPTLEQGDHHP